MFCKNCGIELKDGARFCASCGTAVSVSSPSEVVIQPVTATPVYAYQSEPVRVVRNKRRKSAGLLAIFLGGLGVHSFYLGYTGIALIQIVLFALGLATFGATSVASIIWGYVDAIRIFKGKLDKDADDNPLI